MRYGPFGTYISVPGTNGKASVFRVEYSPYWYLYARLDGRTIRRSTGTADQTTAFQIARCAIMDFETGTSELQATSKHPTFEQVARSYLEAEWNRVALGEVGERSAREEEFKLKSHIVPSLGDRPVSAITKATVNDYLVTLMNERGVSIGTRNKYLVVIRKALKHAWETGALNQMPPLPSSKRDDRPRGYFNEEELDLLTKTVQGLVTANVPIPLVKQGKLLRYLRLNQDTVDFVAFAVSSFVRPSDLKLMRHSHLTFYHDQGWKCCSLIP